MSSLTMTRCCVLLLTVLGSADAFTSLLTTTTNTKLIATKHSIKSRLATTSSTSTKTATTFVLQMSSKNNEQDENNSEDDSGMSFDDATAALADQEDQERAAARGAMYEEDNKRFAAKKSEFDEMRTRIRSRASDLNMKKSTATVEAIKAATQRAQAGEEAATPTVDLSKFSSSLGGANGEEDPEDVLTDEQKKEIDKVGQLSIIEQIKEEYKNTKFPTPSATLKQALLMVVIFVVTAGVILKADELLRFQITDWGFIPRSGEVVDYSDLSLPEGFTDAMTDTDLASM